MTNSLVTVDAAVEQLRAHISAQASHDPKTIVVTSGRFHSDGEAIEVLVRLTEDGERVVVSDGGMTMARRYLYGADHLGQSASRLWEEIITDYGVETISDRIYLRGPINMIANLIGLIADTAVALDAVRLLSETKRKTFTEKLHTWLADMPGVRLSGENVVEDSYGDNQRVSAIVESRRGPILVQGAGGTNFSNVRQAAEHAYFVFTGLDATKWEHERRLIVLERLPLNTDLQQRNATSLVSRLTEHSYVSTFESRTTVGRFLCEAAGTNRDLATMPYGQASSDI